MKVTLTADDGREYDITEHFQVMYDQLTNGMDWGSGFLDGGEALMVMQVGAAAGFKVDVYDQGLAARQWWPDYEYKDQSWYDELKRNRDKWIKENLGDPITWDSVAAYRERLTEMENAE